MRHILLSILLLLPLGIQAEPAFLPTLVPDSKTCDFGRVSEADGKRTHTFRLTNRGTRPVAISAVNTWCGCMVADYTRRAVRPGETAEVRVTFDPDHKQGNFVKQVVVLLSGGSEYVRLWVKADVVAMRHPVREDHPYSFGHGLYMSQQILPFPNMPVGRSHAFTVKVANDTPRPMTVELRRRPCNTVLRMPATLTLRPYERTTMRVSYTQRVARPYDCHIDVVPVVDGKECRPLRVKWNGRAKFRLGI